VRETPLLLVILLIAAIYVLPNTLALLSGSHTMEADVGTQEVFKNPKSLECLKCHQYIYDELDLNPNSQTVLTAHRRAAGNGSDVGNYTTHWLSMNLSNTSDVSLCQFCHLAKVDITFPGAQLSTAHTQTTIRMCTDIFCHGNNQSTRNLYPDAGNVSGTLGQVDNAHRRWFTELSGLTAPHVNETGANYTKSYYACLGCHTEVGMKVTFQNRDTETFNHYDPDDENATRRYL